MKGDGRSDPRPILALAAVLVIAALWRGVSSIRLDHLLASAASLAPLALGGVAIALALAPQRFLATRRALTARAAVAVIPADEFDPKPETVLRFAAELARYAELYRLAGGDREPLWRSRYPVFPPVHCVLAGSRRTALERRRSTTTALLRSDPRLARAPEVRISFCLLEDLQARGPFAPIFRDVRDPGRPIDWLGVGAT